MTAGATMLKQMAKARSRKSRTGERNTREQKEGRKSMNVGKTRHGLTKKTWTRRQGCRWLDTTTTERVILHDTHGTWQHICIYMAFRKLSIIRASHLSAVTYNYFWHFNELHKSYTLPSNYTRNFILNINIANRVKTNTRQPHWKPACINKSTSDCMWHRVFLFCTTYKTVT